MISININTEYSLLKSLIKIDNLCDFATKNNINNLCICDNEMFGVMPFYLAGKKHNINPIIGLKVFISDKEFLVYAKNYNGYKDLIKINTKKFNNKLSIDDLNNDNLVIVIPYEYSIDLTLRPNYYIGYKNEREKQSALLITDNIIYSKNVRCLKKEDIKYLNILNEFNNFNYEDDEYLDVSKDRLDEYNNFCKLFNLDIPFNNKYLPKYKEGINSFEYLKKLALVGLKKRIGQINEEYLNRLNYELDIINSMGFVDYFLIVYDYVLFAKKNNILVGPGRGSAAGSLVSFSIGITDIDPIKYDLLFARFLNPSRAKMPDIDIDFQDDKRSDVIEYVKKKYGYDKVAVGLTFNTLKSRLVLRDVGKVLKIDNNLLEKFLKEVDGNKSLKDNLDNINIKKYLKIYKELNNLYDISIHLEGLKKNISTHAAGIIISPINLDEVIPIYIENDQIKTGYTMDYMEMLGLLKMDFLGLKNLNLLADMEKRIKDFKLNEIPLDDKKTFDIFKNADTDDIFQFESRYVKNNLIKLNVTNFLELVNAIALVRPGPSNQIDAYIKGVNEDKNLSSILKDTRGVIIFQEQVMQIFKLIGGYTDEEADNIRSAMSKKKEDIMLKEEDIFIKRALKNGYSEKYAKDLYEKMKSFSEYGFNKAHSVSYALISYQMAYIKANYPIEFYLAFLDSDKRIIDKLKRYGVKILKPNINLSDNDYKYKNKTLLLPFTSINGISQNITKLILEERKTPFKDIYDFMLRCYSFINEKIFETLVYSGVFDTFKINKKGLIESYDILNNYASLGLDDANKPIIKNDNDFTIKEIMQKENELYGFYVGNHPCSLFKREVNLSNYKDYLFKNTTMYFIIENIKSIKTKNGDNMAFLTINDEYSTDEATVFSECFNDLKDIKKGDLVEANVKISKRFDKISIIVNNIKRK